MGGSDNSRRIHFQSPEYLVDRLDAIAELFDTDRTDLLVEAIREYIEETPKSETFQEPVATKYYDDHLEFETAKQLVGTETAQRFRLLKADLEDELIDLATPDDVDVYDDDGQRLRPQPTTSDELPAAANGRCRHQRARQSCGSPSRRSRRYGHPGSVSVSAHIV